MSSYRSVFRPGLFAGQLAVVTGGGSGIGRCTAHELASLGAAVAIVGRKADKLDAVRVEIEAAGATCTISASTHSSTPPVASSRRRQRRSAPRASTRSCATT
jgi:NAD(P)-dependent dehydrogenase (short-subunit alcohol dehydrogenase family)